MSSDSAPNATILIVDDDPLVRRMVSRVLAHAGYRVVTHESGFGLSGVVRKHRPDLLILDVNMPGLGGDAALGVLRGLEERFGTTRVPVVFHSGMPAERLEALAEAHGAAGHLRKPAGNAKILQMVEYALAQQLFAHGTP